MASEKQIAANRANAKRSTGPKSAVGKLRSSRNAYRHGLSCPLRFDPASAKVEAIIRVLVDEGAGEQQLAAAAAFAGAELELLRIRAVRSEIHRKIDLNLCDTKELHRLLAFHRYERLARTRRRRASYKFKLVDEHDRTGR